LALAQAIIPDQAIRLAGVQQRVLDLCQSKHAMVQKRLRPLSLGLAAKS